MFVNSPVGIYNVCEYLVQFRCMCSVDTFDRHLYVLLENSDTSLLSFLNVSILMRCFNTLESSRSQMLLSAVLLLQPNE